MFLKRSISRILFRLFPGYAAERARKEADELRSLARQLFSGPKIEAVFPHLKMRRNAESGKWSLRIDDRAEAYLLLNALPNLGRSVTKYKSDRIQTSVPIDPKSLLTLVEYLYPTRTRPGISGRDEVLLARTLLQTGIRTERIMDFYMDAAKFYRGAAPPKSDDCGLRDL